MKNPESVVSYAHNSSEIEKPLLGENSSGPDAADSPTQHLLLSGKVAEQDGVLVHTGTGGWYVPLEERSGKVKDDFAAHIAQGSHDWSAAIGVHSPNLR